MKRKLFILGLLCMPSLFAFDCFQSIFDCLTITPKIGVAPTVFTDRGCNYVVLPTTTLVNPVISIGQTPKFNSLFKVPVYVGGEISWQACENRESFVELVYRHGKGRCVQIPVVIAQTPATFGADLTAFKALGFYAGTRCGWESWCSLFNWFVGAKVGLVHHWQVNADLSANSVAIQSCTPIYFKNTVVSGGAQLGIEKSFCGCFGMNLIAEVVASGGLKNNRNAILTQSGPLGVTNVNFAEIGTEVSFPVSVGFSYSF